MRDRISLQLSPARGAEGFCGASGARVWELGRGEEEAEERVQLPVVYLHAPKTGLGGFSLLSALGTEEVKRRSRHEGAVMFLTLLLLIVKKKTIPSSLFLVRSLVDV